MYLNLENTLPGSLYESEDRDFSTDHKMRDSPKLMEYLTETNRMFFQNIPYQLPIYECEESSFGFSHYIPQFFENETEKEENEKQRKREREREKEKEQEMVNEVKNKKNENKNINQKKKAKIKLNPFSKKKKQPKTKTQTNKMENDQNKNAQSKKELSTHGTVSPKNKLQRKNSNLQKRRALSVTKEILIKPPIAENLHKDQNKKDNSTREKQAQNIETKNLNNNKPITSTNNTKNTNNTNTNTNLNCQDQDKKKIKIKNKSKNKNKNKNNKKNLKQTKQYKSKLEKISFLKSKYFEENNLIKAWGSFIKNKKEAIDPFNDFQTRYQFVNEEKSKTNQLFRKKQDLLKLKGKLFQNGKENNHARKNSRIKNVEEILFQVLEKFEASPTILMVDSLSLSYLNKTNQNMPKHSPKKETKIITYNQVQPTRSSIKEDQQIGSKMLSRESWKAIDNGTDQLFLTEEQQSKHFKQQSKHYKHHSGPQKSVLNHQKQRILNGTEEMNELQKNIEINNNDNSGNNNGNRHANNYQNSTRYSSDFQKTNKSKNKNSHNLTKSSSFTFLKRKTTSTKMTHSFSKNTISSFLFSNQSSENESLTNYSQKNKKRNKLKKIKRKTKKRKKFKKKKKQKEFAKYDESYFDQQFENAQIIQYEDLELYILNQYTDIDDHKLYHTQIKSGELDSLINEIIFGVGYDQAQNFQNNNNGELIDRFSFLLCFKSFVESAIELLELIIQKYNINEPIVITKEQLKYWKRNLLPSKQLKVLGFLFFWVRTFPYHFQSSISFRKIFLNFIKNEKNNKSIQIKKKCSEILIYLGLLESGQKINFFKQIWLQDNKKKYRGGFDEDDDIDENDDDDDLFENNEYYDSVNDQTMKNINDFENYNNGDDYSYDYGNTSDYDRYVDGDDDEHSKSSKSHDTKKKSTMFHEISNIKYPSPILNKIETKNQSFDFLKSNAQELARQFSLMDIKLFKKIHPNEFLDLSWSKGESSLEKTKNAPNIHKFIQRFNQNSLLISTQILKYQTIEQRSKMVIHAIKIANWCYKLRNINTMMAILAALDSSPIHRLKKTWKHISQRHLNQLEKLKNITDKNFNFIKIRKIFEMGNCIPYLGIILSDLTFIYDGNQNKLQNNHINFQKYRKISKIVFQICKLQSSEFYFKRVKIIQKFLKNEKNFMNPNLLFQLSLEVEPRN
ncbi:guanine nucleotide exchange factor [Anaeramoeba flamelloides]|uniref:Guanine nucleotide exchange factor n=1 Tax=Anaeramoeba flamelloides TaxID=1746091 RepID=A0ABQ8XN63_9EUKA|nr:guanine nucleotide exchange factor [Anaeramoeba flamelloides]